MRLLAFCFVSQYDLQFGCRLIGDRLDLHGGVVFELLSADRVAHSKKKVFVSQVGVSGQSFVTESFRRSQCTGILP
jgi:hypothetical protein